MKICIIFLLFFSQVSAQITIAFDTQSLTDAKKPSKKQLLDINKIQKIADKYGIQVTFKAIPWKRSLLMVEKGLIDGVINASYKIERAKYAYYPMKDGKPDNSKRLNDGSSYYIYRNIDSTLRWDGIHFSTHATVAAMDKYAVIDDLKKHPNITIKTFTKNAEIIRKLSKGELDAYAGSARITDNLLKKYPSFAKNIVRESIPIRKKPYFVIFSKITYKEKSKEMEIIWNELQKTNKNE